MLSSFKKAVDRDLSHGKILETLVSLQSAVGVRVRQGPQKELGQGRSDTWCWAETRDLQRRGEGEQVLLTWSQFTSGLLVRDYL